MKPNGLHSVSPHEERKERHLPPKAHKSGKARTSENEEMIEYKTEKEILELSAQCWNNFTNLKQTHPNDIDEFAKAVHQIQQLIAVRICRRTHPDIFPLKSKNCLLREEM